MIDRMAISKRFFACYPGVSRSKMAELFDVKAPGVTIWASKGRVPWINLKYLSDTQAVSWDWIIEGIEPKSSIKEPKAYKTTKLKFNRAKINQRFFSLYGDTKQTRIAAMIGVTPATVHDWSVNRRQIPWQRLADAVDAFGLRWDWLIDGLEPQYRIS